MGEFHGEPISARGIPDCILCGYRPIQGGRSFWVHEDGISICDECFNAISYKVPARRELKADAYETMVSIISERMGRES